jgi:hypothetical protein
MLVTLDLTARQAARVLSQAVRTRAKLEIEPRPEAYGMLLWGSFAAREPDLLLVELYEGTRELPLNSLIGAMCEVRTILSGQLCLFSTFVVDAADSTVPQRITLALPQTIQVANRRRFARKTATEPIPLRLSIPGSQTPFVAMLSNISPSGVGCRVVSRDLDEILFIGDQVTLEFVLPWSNDVYTLPASVCSKSPAGPAGQLTVGFEFITKGYEAVVDRLRTALQQETARLIEMDGEP